MKMTILIVEDDYLQSKFLKELLEKHFASARVQQIFNESEFRSSLPSICKDRPDLILLDVMLRWADPSPDIEPAPEDVRKGGYFRAGLRCERLLRENEETRVVPIVLYTVLEASVLEKELMGGGELRVSKHTSYLGKSSEPRPLIEKIGECIKEVGA